MKELEKNKKVTIVTSVLYDGNGLLRLISSVTNDLEKIHLIVFLPKSDISNFLKSELRARYSKLTFEIKLNSGLSLAASRQLGAELSKTDFIAFIDDDIILPKFYFETGIDYLEKNPSIDGVGGRYSEKSVDTREERKLTRAIARLFLIRSMSARNVIKSNTWTDVVSIDNRNKITDAEWLHGCNGIFRKKIFENDLYEEKMQGWSYLEDVLMGFRATKIHHYRFQIHPKLEVTHEDTVSEGLLTGNSVKMRILYRYLIWREMKKENKGYNCFSFWWSMLGNSLMLIRSKPSRDILWALFSSYIFLLNPNNRNWEKVNEYIS